VDLPDEHRGDAPVIQHANPADLPTVPGDSPGARAIVMVGSHGAAVSPVAPPYNPGVTVLYVTLEGESSAAAPPRFTHAIPEGHNTVVIALSGSVRVVGSDAAGTRVLKEGDAADLAPEGNAVVLEGEGGGRAVALVLHGVPTQAAGKAPMFEGSFAGGVETMGQIRVGGGLRGACLQMAVGLPTLVPVAATPLHHHPSRWRRRQSGAAGGVPQGVHGGPHGHTGAVVLS